MSVYQDRELPIVPQMDDPIVMRYFVSLRETLTSIHIDQLDRFNVVEDLQIDISDIKKPPSSSPIDRYYNHGIGGGITFPVLGFSVGDYIYYNLETSHSMALNELLRTHIHFVLPNTTNIGDKFQFKIDVIVATLDGTWTVPTGSPFSVEYTIIVDDNIKGRFANFTHIPQVNTTISTIYKCRLERIAASSNEYGSEVYFQFIDNHYLQDTHGSKSDEVK